MARRVIRENSGIRDARRAASVGVARSAGQGQSCPQASQIQEGPSAVCARPAGRTRAAGVTRVRRWRRDLHRDAVE
ncbi:hypothetical protein ACLQ24_16040 [Micromonospora sp. DT4]|uniref:hypothetical protein n=1 Tax=Micromonospora sp. DT4 TaxID=3393438 RepID=UPI003CF5E47A